VTNIQQLGTNFTLFFYLKRPRPGDPPRIERDDFPAPPYPYTDPERRRRWSETHRRASTSELSVGRQDEFDGKDIIDPDEALPDDPKIKVETNLDYFVLFLMHSRFYYRKVRLSYQK
jgi:hypothetical protein